MIEPHEPHVHFPSSCLTIAAVDPDNAGIRCKHCNIPLDMSEGEWREFVRYWVFTRFGF